MDYGVFDPILDSIIIINEERLIVYCNEAAASLCGYSVKRLINKRQIFDLFEFDVDNFFLTKEGTAFKTGMPLTEVKFRTLNNGKDGNIQLTLNPFMDEGVELWTIVLRDVTLEEVLHKKYQGQLIELEAYSKNLETMVNERTAELKEANTMLSAIMESLGQGFMVVDHDGKCSNIRTKVCNDILETDPIDQKVEDVLKVPEKDKSSFSMWLRAIYEENLPFDSLKNLGPNRFAHSKNRHIILDYYPIRNEENGIQNIVVMATDKTSEYEANKKLEIQRLHVQMVMKLLKSKKQFKTFLKYIDTSLAEIKILIDGARSAGLEKLDSNFIFRVLHTLEGEAITYGAHSIHIETKRCQDRLFEIGDNFSLNLPRFELSMADLHSVYKEFLIENDSLFKAIGLNEVGRIQLEKEDIHEVIAVLREEKISEKALEKILECLLTEPLTNYFGHFNDIVSSVSVSLQKSTFPIIFKNGHIKINGDYFSHLLTSFVHIFRNSVDHGIELSEQRKSLGKNASGQIWFEAEKLIINGEKWLRFIIRDDGQGIDPEMIRLRLSQTHPASGWQEQVDEDVIQHIFDVGFSGKDEVSDFSGRGVGMNAVKKEAEILNGKVRATSIKGRGTAILIEVPLAPLLLPLEKAS